MRKTLPPLTKQNVTPNKTFRTLNHPYTMKIALIKKEISEKTAPPQIINHQQQRNPIKSKTPELVPNFDAR